jgi:DNA mismatch repair ATPase MutS
LPKLTDGDRHYFRAKNLINAGQSDENPNYVPNDIDIGDGQRLTFFTGPNSGGKSSLCKAIAQAQVLAQAGGYVPADSAEIGLCDKLFYQTGVNDCLSDNEGGLGTQLKIAKEVLFSSTPKSLVVIDDLIDGTTFREKTEQTRNQLYGFLHKRADTIFVTHHHELAQEFAGKNVGQYLQTGFNCKKPTYNIIPGISTDSHADAVAERVGVNAERIREHLISKGYLLPNIELRDISGHVRQENDKQ